MKWKKAGMGKWELNENYAYPGISAIVFESDGQYSFILSNGFNEPQTEREQSRKPKKSRSPRSWATLRTAQKHAEICSRKMEWLESCGIKFK